MTPQEQAQVNKLFTDFVTVAGQELKALRQEVETLKAEMKALQSENEALTTDHVCSVEYQLNPSTD